MWMWTSETEEHVLFECNRYGQERERWRRTIEILEDGMCEYQVIIKGYHEDNDEMEKEKENIRYWRGMWNSRQRNERLREFGLE